MSAAAQPTEPAFRVRRRVTLYEFADGTFDVAWTDHSDRLGQEGSATAIGRDGAMEKVARILEADTTDWLRFAQREVIVQAAVQASRARAAMIAANGDSPARGIGAEAAAWGEALDALDEIIADYGGPKG